MHAYREVYIEKSPVSTTWKRIVIFLIYWKVSENTGSLLNENKNQPVFANCDDYKRKKSCIAKNNKH